MRPTMAMVGVAAKRLRKAIDRAVVGCGDGAKVGRTQANATRFSAMENKSERRAGSRRDQQIPKGMEETRTGAVQEAWRGDGVWRERKSAGVQAG